MRTKSDRATQGVGREIDIERERERERDPVGFFVNKVCLRERGTERENVYVCVCVYLHLVFS